MGSSRPASWRWHARAIAFAVVFCAGDAAAQVVSVSFESAQAEGIPISGWAVVSLAAVLGFAAYRALRSTAGRALALLATISAVVAMVHWNWIRDAHAADPAVMSLDTSPTQLTIPPEAIFAMTMSGAGYRITVVNATGGPVMITDVAIAGDNVAFYSGTPGPRCAVGLIVGTHATCYLYVLAPNHFD